MPDWNTTFANDPVDGVPPSPIHNRNNPDVDELIVPALVNTTCRSEVPVPAVFVMVPLLTSAPVAEPDSASTVPSLSTDTVALLVSEPPEANCNENPLTLVR